MTNKKFSATPVKGAVLGRNILSVSKLKEPPEDMKGLTLRTLKVIGSIKEPFCEVDVRAQDDHISRCIFHGRGVFQEEIYVPTSFLVPCKTVIPPAEKKGSEFRYLTGVAA
jgi:hypothetical protein